MLRPQTPIPGHQFIHADYHHDKADNRSFIVANVKDKATGVSTLHICDSLRYPFWVTKPGARTHEYKKEFAPMSELDMYQAPPHRFGEEIARTLGTPWLANRGFKKVLDSPFVYGGDIDPAVLFKLDYRKVCTDPPKGLNIGAMDIETSVLGGKEVNCFSYVDGLTHNVYCGILAPFLKGFPPDKLYALYTEKYAEFLTKVNAKAKALLNAKPFNVTFQVFDQELEVIKWVYARIHEHKPDFCLVWNIGFDKKVLISRIEYRGANPEDIICHPEVPKKYRHFFFKEDMKKKEHIVDKWHWVYCTGYTQWVDGMCLYGRLRKAKGRKASYKLDAIAGESVGTGKLDFGNFSTHEEMQEKDFPGYCVYNCFDSILVVLQEELNRDVYAMLNLIGGSHLANYAHQTVQLKNKFYEYLLRNKLVLGSVGRELLKGWDSRIFNVGGAVLNPLLARETGVRILQESRDVTLLQTYVSDLDIGSSYPNNTASRNISGETLIAAILEIQGLPSEAVNEFGELLIDMKENAVRLGHRFFGLPDFTEVNAILETQYPTRLR